MRIIEIIKKALIISSVIFISVVVLVIILISAIVYMVTGGDSSVKETTYQVTTNEGCVFHILERIVYEPKPEILYFVNYDTSSVACYITDKTFDNRFTKFTFTFLCVDSKYIWYHFNNEGLIGVNKSTNIAEGMDYNEFDKPYMAKNLGTEYIRLGRILSQNNWHWYFVFAKLLLYSHDKNIINRIRRYANGKFTNGELVGRLS